MPTALPAALVEFILLGPRDDRRQLQDSPILGDVWIAFAKAPDKPLEVLITPYKTQRSADVATELDAGLRATTGVDVLGRANIAYLQGIVVAQLTFTEVLGVVVPMTRWWADRWKPTADPAGGRHELELYGDQEAARRAVRRLRAAALAWTREPSGPAGIDPDPESSSITPLDRYIVLSGLMFWAATPAAIPPSATTSVDRANQIMEAVDEQVLANLISTRVRALFDAVKERKPKSSLVWQISLNRTAKPALTRSIPAVKADAAHTLFRVDCREIAWAVIDSGIDGGHPAFLTAKDVSRVRRCFDFTRFRQIVTLSNAIPAVRDENVRLLLERAALLKAPTADDAARDLQRLADDLRHRRPIHWELVEQFVEMDPKTARPPTNHGTHVAGILGGSVRTAKEFGTAGDDCGDGMCPDIQLYDFRVLGPTLRETEFAIIAVLQFIRHLNERDNFFTIHGVNLSLSIPHDVRNFACGRTPICNECERLVESGVVVVAAAGNHGYKTFETQEGAYESYAAFSITDPGNADSIITVGATHRHWPHTYGVSFFSSRGPTGDGRLKPDLVAPGERIRAPFPNGEWGDLDGTSMAAPHVSGAAAMLMARYSELIGQPRRIKRILCDTATDLGRERTFQGRGMLDVLRAFQSI
jgi:hypothetical protein